MKKQRRLSTMDVQTLLGRVRGNESDRGIARAMDISRTTVKNIGLGLKRKAS
jgi:DNA-binding CsgD family transcriptional regulator